MTTPATRQKAYRERKRAELGEVAWKALQARKRKENRRQNAKPKRKNKDEMRTLTDTFKQINLSEDNKNARPKEKPANIIDCRDNTKMLIAGGLSEATAQSYLKKVGRVYQLMHENKKWDCKGVEWLKDHERVIKFITEGKVPSWTTSSTRATHLNHVHAFVMRVPELKSSEQFYAEAKNKTNTEQTDLRREQTLKPTWRELVLPWRQLVKLNDTADFKSTFDEAVFGIFTLIPPRRSGTYYDLLIQPVGHEANTANYLTIDGKGNPLEIVLNRYKTAKFYGEYRIKVPRALQIKLKKHIAGVPMGGPVFANQTTGEPYTEPRAFNQATTNVFKKHTGKAIGSDILRISYASFKMFGGKRVPSLKQQNETAKTLGHALQTHQTYARFGIESARVDK